MLKVVISFSLALACFSAAMAAERDPVLQHFALERAKWHQQSEQSRSDQKLVADVWLRFLVAAGIDGSGETDAANQALAPLRARFPDYRLQFLGERDFCTVLEALQDARLSALKREISGINNEKLYLFREQDYLGISILFTASALTGDPVTKNSIEKKILSNPLEKEMEGPVLDWGNWDYLESRPPSIDRCNGS